MTELGIELAKQGYAIQELPNAQGPATATYYDKNGKAYPGLPTDPYSRRHYERRGFRLSPPPTKP